MRCEVVAVAMVLAGCATGPVLGRDGGGEPSGVTLSGRVLDAESCSMRCEGVAGIVVRYDPTGRVSEPTGADGAFGISGLPLHATIDLVAEGPSHAPTLNPGVADTADDDVFGAQIYALPDGAGSLLSAVEAELGDAESLHFGQVVRAEGLVLMAVEGAGIEVDPPVGPIRIVNVPPSLGTGEPALKPATETRTGRFGMYVIAGETGPTEVTVRITADGLTFDPVETVLLDGRPSFVLHQAR